jgi:hypothetical protein
MNELKINVLMLKKKKSVKMIYLYILYVLSESQQIFLTIILGLLLFYKLYNDNEGMVIMLVSNIEVVYLK